LDESSNLSSLLLPISVNPSIVVSESRVGNFTPSVREKAQPGGLLAVIQFATLLQGII
jgi:hypothetical protein